MVDAPHCPVCQAKHWSNQAHRFQAERPIIDRGSVSGADRTGIVIGPAREQPADQRDKLIADLRAKIAELEAQLDVRKRTDRERAKAYRERRKGEWKPK